MVDGEDFAALPLDLVNLHHAGDFMPEGALQVFPDSYPARISRGHDQKRIFGEWTSGDEGTLQIATGGIMGEDGVAVRTWHPHMSSVRRVLVKPAGSFAVGS